MKNTLLPTLALVPLLTLSLTAVALAQTTDTSVPGHPRVNEVDARLAHQQNRVDGGVAKGTVGATKESHDATRDAKVSQEMSADEAKNGGHLTKTEQERMNRQLNRNSTHIYDQKHDGTTPSPAPTAPPAAQ